MTLNSIFFYSSPTEILIFCILGGGGGGDIKCTCWNLVRFSAAICGIKGALHNNTKNGCVVDYLGALLGIIVGGVLSSSPNPDPISEQQESFSIPIFRPGL